MHASNPCSCASNRERQMKDQRAVSGGRAHNRDHPDREPSVSWRLPVPDRVHLAPMKWTCEALDGLMRAP